MRARDSIMAQIRSALLLSLCGALLALPACDDGKAPKDDKAAKPAKSEAKAAKAAPKSGPPEPARDALEGEPTDAILLSQAWFYKDAGGKSKPGPARLQIWRKNGDKWKATRLEDADSNVFHKALLLEDGSILTAAGEKAMLKKWKHEGGKWSSELLWEQSWGGKFNRLRDIEVGDVDGDAECFISPNRCLHTAIYTPFRRAPEHPVALGHPLDCCLQT